MTNEEVLAAMTKFAGERRQRENEILGGCGLHGGFDGYVRVTGTGFRAVSVSPGYPLCGFKKGPTRTFDTALTQMSEEPRRLKEKSGREERCVQAHMIRKALMARGDLLSVLGPGLPFDQLEFAFDEVRVTRAEDTIRCDLLAVGRSQGTHEPVLIELKFNRALTRLLVQLESFAEQIRTPDLYRGAFERLLSAAAGKQVSAARVHKVIVWPEGVRFKHQTDQAARENVHVFGYQVSRTEGCLPVVEGFKYEGGPPNV